MVTQIKNMEEDVELVGKLSDQPNLDDGLTAQELKEVFDKGPALLKAYLNGTLVPAINQLLSQPPADGLTPYIGENGNWWIGDTDTGVKAAGQDGADGASGAAIFIAQYDVTTNAEIYAAYKSGKLVFAQDGSDAFLFPACMITATNANFICYTGPRAFKMACTNDAWSTDDITLENAGNRVTVIDENSTDSKYPTAKAVHTALQAVENNLVCSVNAIAVTEAADGTVTMVNTLDNGTETIILTPDGEGNPSRLSYNGKEIPISWAVSG